MHPVAPDPLRSLRHRLLNSVHTALALGAMAALAGYIGWSLFGAQGLLWTAALALVATALSPRVSPRWVLRLSGARELAPWQAPALHAVVRELAARAELPRAPRLYYVPSRALNAFATGSREDSAVALTDGLLRSLTLRELAAVLAHEVAHVAADDLKVMNLADVVGRVTALLSLAGQALLVAMLPAAALRGYEPPLDLIAVLILAPTVTLLLQLALSRTREYQADLAGAELVGDPAALASALDKLERLQGGWMERMFMAGGRVPKWLRTHPPMAERIRRLAALLPPRRQAAWDRLDEFAQLEDVPEVTRPPRWHWNGLWY
ncbi:MAG TPA: zinc metalloprotease HtpX [Burkholderiales bacterium]|nr:zinc metalloprotease HtpX [Burkholderiales bacterium]